MPIAPTSTMRSELGSVFFANAPRIRAPFPPSLPPCAPDASTKTLREQAGILNVSYPPALANCLLPVQANVADTLCSASIVTVQARVPEHAPARPPNEPSKPTLGDSVTIVPNGNTALHRLPQEIPGGSELT